MITRCSSSLPGATNGAILIFKFNDFVSATEKIIVARVALVQRLSRSAMLQPYQRYFSDSLEVKSILVSSGGTFGGKGGGSKPARNCGWRQSQIRSGWRSTFSGSMFHVAVARALAPRALMKMLAVSRKRPASDATINSKRGAFWLVNIASNP